jgi:hypothetical protein
MTAFDDVKDYLSIAQAAATTLVVVVGGVWGCFAYLESRDGHSRANIEHQLMHFNVNKNLTLLRVALVVSNESKRRLDLNHCEWTVEQILPPDAHISKQIRSMYDEIADGNPINNISKSLYLPTILQHEEKWEDGSFIVEPNQEAVLVKFFAIPLDYKLINVTTFCTDSKRFSADGIIIGSYIETTHTLEEWEDEGEPHEGGNHSGGYNELSQ